ncbi:MAG TPA: hypothetical protein VFZ83_04800 [Acidimicrobiia bacterium]|nr:hypothetical protein [Acidimicrobiia bacterium]
MTANSPSAPERAPQVRATVYVGVFLVTLSTLVLEISLTRIFSVTMWYHFAFLAISIALFGMTFGALAVHLLPERFPAERAADQMARFSIAFGVAIAVCFAIQLQIPFTPRATVGGIASVVATCVVIAIPFVMSGIVVCLALTKFPARVNRLYAVDLIGAGLGCVALVLLFEWFDGPSLVVLTGAIATIAGVAFATAACSRRLVAVACVATLLLGGFAVINAARHDDGDPILDIVWTKEERDTEHDYERWNAFSRLTVDGDTEDPNTILLSLLIDSTAGTALPRFTGDLEATDYLRDQISNLAHHARSDADVAVVGAGGGADVLSAVEFDQRSVTGIEINGDTVDIVNNVYGEFTGHLDEHPRVDIVTDEARSYLTRTDRRFDIIQISLIDTWAATGAGAFALSENGLYTTDAWDTFLDRLQPGGILSVARFHQTIGNDGEPVEPLEAYRTVALAAQVLTDRGVENPRDHLAVYRIPTAYDVDVATVLVSRDPFTARDLGVFEREAERLGFTPVLTPDVVEDPFFADLTAPGGPSDAVDDLSADISPPTDNRPFFFQMADLGTLFDSDILRDDFVMRPVLVLAILAVTVLGLASLCIAFPVVVARRRGARLFDRRSLPFATFFGGIGLGFLLIEIAQLQRLSIFLGHPTYGLTVVLFSVLVFSGLGSMLTERFVDTERPVTLVAPLVTLLGVLVVAAFATPALIRTFDAATTPVRIAVSVGLLAPIALVMGMPFAIGMRTAAAHGAPTAFLWAINGAMSVCASVFAVVIALFFGIAAAFWTGVAAYCVAVGSIVAVARRRTTFDLGVVDPPTPEPVGVAAR